MSDQQNVTKEQGIVRPYLGFIDTNVLFKKPVSCLLAIVSLLIPVYFLFQAIHNEIFSYGSGKMIAAVILIFLVLAFAGCFGFGIWLYRRIKKDEGPSPYANFRRFVQTLGEWLGTYVAIAVFGCVIVLMLMLKDEYYYVAGLLPVPVLDMDLAAALYGPVAGFVIIILTKIILFLLDPIIWLIKQIWWLFVRVVKFFYRCVLKISGAVEQNTPIWSGIIWLLAVAVVIAALVLCFNYGGLYPAIALALGLAFISFLVYKKKHYES